MATRDFLSGKGYRYRWRREGAGSGSSRPLLPMSCCSDVAMPDMDGMETLSASSPGTNLPVIMVTANADIEITSGTPSGRGRLRAEAFRPRYLDQAISIQLSAGRGT